MTKPERSSDLQELVEQIWLEQVRSLEQGRITPAEDFFVRYPSFSEHPDHAIDVIFNEYAILSGIDSVEILPVDFYRRFPELESRLRKQFELFDAVSEAIIARPAMGAETGQGLESATSSSTNWATESRFEFRRELGRGATSVVWEAWDHQLKRAVAIKKPHSPVQHSRRKKSRFIQEARAVARLHHPNIVPIHEILELENEMCLVSPLIAGKDLQQLTEQKPPEAVQALQWVQQVADALHYAHENGIVHRDVKPSNVLVNSKQRALLTDFGLALDEMTRLSITQSGELIGTPAFMAPEQVTGHGRVDRRADVYSLGVLLYYLLGGKLPFEGSFSTVLHRLISETPDPLRHHNPSVVRELEIITNKCLNKDPDERYQTARALGDDLQRFENGEVIRAKPAGPLVRAFKFAQRKPQLVTAVAISLVALAFAAGTLFQLVDVIDQRNRAIDAEQTNRTLLTEASLSAGQLAMQRGRLGEAVSHFETAIGLQSKPSVEMNLSLVECYLALDNVERATEKWKVAMTQAGNDEPNPLINYWKVELAASGAAEFGEVLQILESADFSGIDLAKQRFLEGLNCANSAEALKCFNAAVAADRYHHSAREMSLIMALSLARFDELMVDVSLAQQLYPEDVDFQLIEAIAMAATDQPGLAEDIIQTIELDSKDRQRWIEFCQFVHRKTRRLNPSGSISNYDLNRVAELISEFTSNHARLLSQRRWRFPPRIALFFDELTDLGSAEDFLSWRERTREAVSTHPEGVLMVIAAESELKDDSVQQLEASRDLFRQATQLPAFIDDAPNAAWLGVYATAVKLVFHFQHEPQKNTAIFIDACRNLDPQSIIKPRDLRTFTITLIQSGAYAEAMPFAKQWIDCSTSKQQLNDATWHLGIVYQRMSNWQSLLELCDERISAEDWSDDYPRQKWTSFRAQAQAKLRELLDSESP